MGAVYMLLYTWNHTKSMGDIRVCQSRSSHSDYHHPCPCEPDVRDETDCPASCFGCEVGHCVLNYNDVECMRDLRCVPMEARNPNKMLGTRQLKLEENRCLTADKGSVGVEECDQE